MKIGVVVPDKCDRPEFLKHCLFLLGKQTVKPDVIHVIDKDFGIKGVDITARYKFGLKKVFEDDDCDVCFFIENDDWYSENYIETMLYLWDAHNRPSLFGLETSVYYHIGLKKYNKMFHAGRASAFSTMCTFEILKCNFPNDTDVFFDIALWKTSLSKKTVVPHKEICLGIKHGEGLCGGRAHSSVFPYKNNDIDMDYLKSIVDKESFEFYESRKQK